MKNSRRKLLVAPRVQLGLAGQLIVHWMSFLMITLCLLPIARGIILVDIETPPMERMKSAGIDIAILLVVFLLMLPCFLYNSIKLSNRFAGPMYRLKMTFRALAGGEEFHQIRFREGDYWHDVADDFNAMMARLGSEATPTNAAPTDAAPEPQAMVSV